MGRVVRQLTVESVMLAFVGGLAGVALAHWSLSAFLALVPIGVRRMDEAAVDSQTFALALLMSIATGLLSGVLPAARAARLDANQVMAHRTGHGMFTFRLGAGLVVAEIALCVVLAVGAGLLMQSFWKLHAYPPGFHPDRILTLNVSFAGPRYRDAAPRRAYADEILRRLSAVGGVQSAAIGSIGSGGMMLLREGESFPPPTPRPVTLTSTVSSRYAQALGMRLVTGRWVTDNEPTPVLVFNEALVSREFGDQDPIGARFQLPGYELATVVGVVADLRYSRLDSGPVPEAFVDLSHGALFRRHRTRAHRWRTQRRSLNPRSAKSRRSIPRNRYSRCRRSNKRLATSTAPNRLNLYLLTTFASVAVLLVLIGTYGVVSYMVAQRTSEIGIRIALGAQRAQVVAGVMRLGMPMVVIGVVLGVVAAASLTHLMRALLFRVKPLEPLSFTAVPLLVALTALLAVFVPAWRAATIDPIETLRSN